MLLLIKLAEGAEYKVQCVRAIVCALMTWSSWHSSPPFSEEVNEAALSQLGSQLSNNPAAAMVAQVNQVYMLVQPGKVGEHAVS